MNGIINDNVELLNTLSVEHRAMRAAGAGVAHPNASSGAGAGVSGSAAASPRPYNAGTGAPVTPKIYSERELRVLTVEKLKRVLSSLNLSIRSRERKEDIIARILMKQQLCFFSPFHSYNSGYGPPPPQQHQQS